MPQWAVAFLLEIEGVRALEYGKNAWVLQHPAQHVPCARPYQMPRCSDPRWVAWRHLDRAGLRDRACRQDVGALFRPARSAELRRRSKRRRQNGGRDNCGNYRNGDRTLYMVCTPVAALTSKPALTT